MRPAERAAILSSSLSTQMTSLPRSAKTAPVTSPTYPVPATQMFIRTGGKDYSRAHRRGAGAKLTAPRAAPARVSTGAAAHQEQVEQLRAVRRAREHRLRREDRPPREHGRRDEGQVLDHVEGVMLEGGVIGSGQVPGDERGVVEPEGDREPGEAAEQREQPQAREQGGEQPGRDGGQQERRRRQGQQEVLHHVGAQEGAVAQVVERPVERAREHDERAREGQEAAGGEPPALRARGPQVESGESREAREDLGVPFAHYARAT